MLSPEDIRSLCGRKYSAFLRALVTGEPFFPLDIRFGRPTSSDEWATLQREISTLARGTVGYRIDWTEINTRRWGRQRLPERVWFETEVEFAAALGKQDEVAQFRANFVSTRQHCPVLVPWIAAHPLRVIEYAEVWPKLLLVCKYFQATPRPNLYARELPIEVETKFIETHQTVLRSLLDSALPADARTEVEAFEQRFGLRYEEPLIRFRFLEPMLQCELGFPLADVATPLSEFQRLVWHGQTILIVENKNTFLTLPNCRAIGIWGGGNAATLLGSVDWLADCSIIYWGDIDVHGLHILSRVRTRFPHVSSVLMDIETLSRFSSFVVEAKPAAHESITALLPSEKALYEHVRIDNLLLEQERIPPVFANAQIAAAVGALCAADQRLPHHSSP